MFFLLISGAQHTEEHYRYFWNRPRGWGVPLPASGGGGPGPSSTLLPRSGPPPHTTHLNTKGLPDPLWGPGIGTESHLGGGVALLAVAVHVLGFGLIRSTGDRGRWQNGGWGRHGGYGRPQHPQFAAFGAATIGQHKRFPTCSNPGG